MAEEKATKKAVDNPYGVFNAETKQYEGASDAPRSLDYIKKRQLYGDKGYGFGVSSEDTDAQRAISGSTYQDEKQEMA